MPTYIKAGFWKTLCRPCEGYKGWLNLDELIRDKAGTGVRGWVGSFYDTTTQTAAINTPTPMKLNTTTISIGVNVINDGLGDPTIIKIDNAGIYNIQFSAQLEKQPGGGGGKKLVNIWLRKNNVDVPWTATFVGFVSNSVETVAGWNFFTNASTGDEYQIMWWQDDDVHIITKPANSYPATPSVIVTVNQVG